MLGHRGALSILDKVYKHMRVAKDQVMPTSKATRRELWRVRSLLALSPFDLRTSWSISVCALDGSPFSLGVCQRYLSVGDAYRVNAFAEKWRYAVSGAVTARQHALGIADGADIDQPVADADPSWRRRRATSP